MPSLSDVGDYRVGSMKYSNNTDVGSVMLVLYGVTHSCRLPVALVNRSGTRDIKQAMANNSASIVHPPYTTNHKTCSTISYQKTLESIERGICN